MLVISSISGSHIVFALLALPLVITMAWSNPEAMLGILPVWMVLMGLIRRLTPGGGNVTFSGDPVLLVGPIALLILWAVVASRRESVPMSSLARWVLAFNVLAFVEAFNPSQGKLITGIGGLLFVLIPTMGFWVGRRYGDADIALRIVWTVAIMGLMAAIYGLIQQVHGFPSWDQRWVQSKGYTALSLGQGVVRPFSFFSSAEEYAVFLAVGATAWVALLGRRTRWPILLHLSALTCILVALYLESQRASFFLVVFAIGIMGASRLGFRPSMVFLSGIISIFILIGAAGALSGGTAPVQSLKGGSTSIGVEANHQTSGLANPLGPSSSLKGHIKATRQGLDDGFKHPLGHGTGSINLAASRYNAHNGLHGSEYDPGNMGIAFGIPGIVIYFFLVFYAFRTAYRLAARRRDAVGLFIIGICAATLFQWTNGDLYSVCWLIWLALGIGDHLLNAPVTAAVEKTDEPSPSDPASGFRWRRPGEAQRAYIGFSPR
jgi:hypothetical protein